MKIAITGIDVGPPWNEGIKNNAFSLAKALKRAGHDAFVFTMARNLPPHSIIDGVEVYSVKLPRFERKTELYQNFAGVPAFVKQGKKLFEEKKPAIIHGHYPVLCGGILDVLVKNKGAKVVESAYGAFYNKSAASESAAVTFLSEQLPHVLFNNRLAAKICARRFDLILPVNEFAARQLKGVAGERKIRVVPNGVNTAEFNPKRRNRTALAAASKNLDLQHRARFDPKKPAVLYLGHLTHAKGVPVLLRAFARASKKIDSQLVLAWSGGGTEDESVRETTEALGIQKKTVFLKGRIKGASPATIMASCDVFVLPRIHEYGTVLLPNTVLEAMASGTPVITSDLGGIGELVRKGNGVTVPPKNEKALAEAIEMLLGSAKLRKRVSEAGLKTAKEFEWRKLARDYVKAYESVL